MKFLIDASRPRQTSQILADAGYQSVDFRDIGMNSSADTDIAAYAQAHALHPDSRS